MDNRGYTVAPFPRSRQIVVDAGRLGVRRHVVHGLLELDVTHARAHIRDLKARSGESLSFTAFFLTCLAQAVRDHPQVQAYRNWRNQLIQFTDVDAVTMIEAHEGGVAVPHIVRMANRKSLREIHDEIRAIQSQRTRSEQQGVLARLGAHAPGFVRDLLFRALRLNPPWLKKHAGTVVVTAVGMFGRGAGWGVGFLPMHTLGITLGGIAEKPAVIDGRIVPREYLSVTISVDHDIVDGAPAARFADRLRELVESGYGL